MLFLLLKFYSIILRNIMTQFPFSQSCFDYLGCLWFYSSFTGDLLVLKEFHKDFDVDCKIGIPQLNKYYLEKVNNKCMLNGEKLKVSHKS